VIRLTRANGKTLYINPQHLIEVGHDEDYKQTLVRTMAEDWYVLESPEEVARKVLEWKLKMAKYQASLYRGNMGAAEIYASGLHMLVGLGDADIDKIVGEFLKEEPNHDTR